MNVTNRNQSLVKSEIRHYFIRLTIFQASNHKTLVFCRDSIPYACIVWLLSVQEVTSCLLSKLDSQDWTEFIVLLFAFMNRDGHGCVAYMAFNRDF